MPRDCNMDDPADTGIGAGPYAPRSPGGGILDGEPPLGPPIKAEDLGEGVRSRRRLIRGGDTGSVAREGDKVARKGDAVREGDGGSAIFSLLSVLTERTQRNGGIGAGAGKEFLDAGLEKS